MAKSKPVLPMSAADRAKQFAPFSPLNGLHRALAKKEKQRVPRKIIPEDKAEELNRALLQLQPGQTVTLVYYDAPEQVYVQLTGSFLKINQQHQCIELDNVSVDFADLAEVIPG